MRQIAPEPTTALRTTSHYPAAPAVAACFLLGVLLAAAVGAQPSPGDPAAAPDPTEAMAHAHAHDAPVASPAVGRPGGPEKVTAETVAYAQVGGKPVEGYLARPAGAKKGGPALLIVHEWWGLNDNIRDFARQFASHGYTTLAVDLYGGASAKDPDQAKALMSAAMKDTAPVEENLRQASHYLHEVVGAGKVGVIGWCFGGGWSLQTALLVPDQISAVVMYYGRPETDRDKLAKLSAPLLGLFGAEDQAIKADGVRQFEATLKDLHKDSDIHIFPGAGHAFANPSGTAYVKPAADEAWKLTLDFLAKHLQGG